MASDINIYDCCVTRFTNETWRENCIWRESNEGIQGCIYNSPFTLPGSIGELPNVFIIEMNISPDSNRIIGVGLVKNRLLPTPHRVYSDNKYNFYTYKGKYRMSREDFTPEELLRIEELERFLFKGYSHLKRGIGFSKLPKRIIHNPGKNKNKIEINNNYTDMFKKAFKRMINTETI
jgi:hypothetical protein